MSIEAYVTIIGQLVYLRLCNRTMDWPIMMTSWRSRCPLLSTTWSFMATLLSYCVTLSGITDHCLFIGLLMDTVNWPYGSLSSRTVLHDVTAQTFNANYKIIDYDFNKKR